MKTFEIENILTLEEDKVAGTKIIIDQLDENQTKLQQAALHFTKEVDRIYLPHSQTCTIHDPLLGRNIIIEKQQSNSTTIWNPWKESGIHDLPHDQYSHFVCVETCNVKEDQESF